MIFLRVTHSVQELNGVVFGGLLLVMGDDKSSSIVMATRDRERERDRELLIPVADSVNDDASSKPSSSTSSSHNTGREVISGRLIGFNFALDRLFLFGSCFGFLENGRKFERVLNKFIIIKCGFSIT